MGIGAATRVVDNDTDLDAANLNTLDSGANVYHSPNGGLNYRVSPATLWLDRGRGPVRFDYAGEASDQAVSPSATTYVFLDQAGATQQNETGFPDTPHIPLARVTSSGSTITAILNRRPSLALLGSADPRLWRTGRLYSATRRAPASTVTLTADTLYGVPFGIQGDQPVDRIGVEVTTLDAGSSIRLGLFAEATTKGEPGLRLEDLGTISGAATGMKLLTITPTRRLPAGRYFVAVISSSAVVAFRAHAAAEVAELGWPGGTVDLQAASLETMWRGSLGGNGAALALPASFPTPTAVAGAAVAAVLRAA